MSDNNLMADGRRGRSAGGRADVAGFTAGAGSGQPGLARRIVQVLSILCEAVSEDVVRDCLVQADGAPGEEALRSALAALESAGQIERTPTGLRCAPGLREVATREAVVEGRYEPMARAVKRVLPVALAWNRTPVFRTRDQGLREVRIAFYRQDSRALQQVLWEYHRQFQADGHSEPPLVTLCARPFDRDWFLALTAPMRSAAAGDILAWSALRLEPCTDLLRCLEQDRVPMPAAVRVFQADVYILQGRFAEAMETLGEVEGPARAVRLAWLAFLRGENEQAVALFESGLHDLRREQSKADAYYRSYGGLFHLLALLKSRMPAHQERLEACLAAAEAEPLWRETCEAIRGVVASMGGGDQSKGDLRLPPEQAPDALALVGLACVCLAQPKALPAERLARLWLRLRESGFEWAASEAAAMLAAVTGRDDARHYAHAFRTRTGVTGLVGTVVLYEAWERALDALAALGQPPSAVEEPTAETRFVWFVKLGETTAAPPAMRPAEQHRTAKGAWTRGRTVPLADLYTLAGRPAAMTEQDHRICAAITVKADRWKPDAVEYAFRTDLALVEMVGHPLLFWEDNPRVRLELVQGEPELIIRESGETIELSMVPCCAGDERVLLLRDTPTRVRLVRLEETHRRVSAILQGGLRLPAHAREKVREAVAPLAARLIVQSDIGSVEAGTTAVPADPTIHVHLLPTGDGLTVELLVQPFGQRGPTYVPARGGTTVVADVGGRRLETVRDVLEELGRAEAVPAACPILEQLPQTDWTWHVESPEECLDLLLQLRALPAAVQVEWPEGRTV